MAKKTVAQSRSNETGSPAYTLRSAKARIKESLKVEAPTVPVGEHPASAAAAEAGAALRLIGDLPVPMKLRNLRVDGHRVRPA